MKYYAQIEPFRNPQVRQEVSAFVDLPAHRAYFDALADSILDGGAPALAEHKIVVLAQGGAYWVEFDLVCAALCYNIDLHSASFTPEWCLLDTKGLRAAAKDAVDGQQVMLPPCADLAPVFTAIVGLREVHYYVLKRLPPQRLACKCARRDWRLYMAVEPCMCRLLT
jgi:hypothetical protein